MTLSRLVIALFAVMTLAPVSPSAAAGRIALVIGNSDYQNAPRLPNPTNDAADMGVALERLGFAVTSATNQGYESMRRTLGDFSTAAAGAEVALVFFAGHGFEIDGRNYLVPVDARLTSDRDASFEAVPLDLVLDAVSGATGLRLVLLDACRDNPFLASMARTDATRSIGRGLSRIEPSTGTLVGYAAKEGTTAADGDGRNSPYASALIEHLAEPELEVSFLFRKVRDSVLAATGNRQEPFTYGSLPGRAFYLNAAATIVSPAADPKPAPDNQSLDLAYWQGVKDATDPALVEGYLAKFPNGVFVDLARARLAAISAQGEPAIGNGDATAPAITPTTVVDPTPDAGQRDLVFEIQRHLDRLGCEPGNPDGVWGPKSDAALSRYSGAAGIAPALQGPRNEALQHLSAATDTVCASALRDTASADAPAATDTPPADLPASRTFRNPKLSGLHIDICVRPLRLCKGQAADAFCKRNGYRKAAHSNFKIFPRTRHIAGGICRSRPLLRCGGYTVIACVS